MPAYPNRTDLQNKAKKIAASAAKGQTYGEAGQQIAAQKAVPMGPSPVSASPTPSVQPGQLGAFNAPTARPNEPVTAGASFGPGPTAQTGGFMVPTTDQTLIELRALYQAYPSPELADMLESYVRDGA